ncbi:triosephosphate isomerase [Stylonychia lemnae]|uniref:Triosephosphate isomerase n=1 Tax=Stylonychia lemnae TaxID=5949 RepID=A0A078AL21_STYLE|nr:triosephosphate isomerase [Stylonychia lemnae]|eukprot:CDW83065.1 triosephosphate isomerase [Stylonychia lemnae]
MVLPGMLHISLVQAMVKNGILVGAQNVSQFESGAYTGEIAAEQIKDYGIEWVMIGHSERRYKFGDTLEIISKKVKLAIENQLGVVLCVGENLEQREKELTNQVLDEQLRSCLASFDGQWENVVIAYEPIWAIGTGKIASADQTQEAHEYIRQWVRDNVGAHIAKDIRIIYGGSVTETNCENLIRLSHVDGFLVGSSSIKPGFRDIFDTVYSYALK